VIALRRSNQPRLVEIDRTTGAEVSAFTFSREALVHAVTTAGGSLHVAGRFRHVDENSSHINLLSLPIARPAASVVPLGVGCSPVGAPPVLTSSRPVLGSLLTDAIVATPSSFGEIYISLVPQAPLPVTPSCVVYLDPQSLALTTHFMTDLNGFANTPYVLPALESLWGLTIRKQAVVYPPLAGFELTNALELTLGY
jgi:hypothetical protein